MRIPITSYEEAKRLDEFFEEAHIERIGPRTYLVIDRTGHPKPIVYKCLGKGCGKIVDETIREAHLLTEHPNFYDLLQEAYKKKDTKKLVDLDHYFEKIKSERLRA